MLPLNPTGRKFWQIEAVHRAPTLSHLNWYVASITDIFCTENQYLLLWKVPLLYIDVFKWLLGNGITATSCRNLLQWNLK